MLPAKPAIIALPPRYTAPVSLFKSASVVSLLTLASRITGLARELLMAATFGASALTDAFNVAFRIPNLLRRLFAEGAFSQAFVPVLAAPPANRTATTPPRVMIGQIATVLAWALTVTCILGVLAAPVLVYAMAAGLKQSPEGFEAAVLMTRWMFPYIAFMSFVALAAGILNTWRRFAVAGGHPGAAERGDDQRGPLGRALVCIAGHRAHPGHGRRGAGRWLPAARRADPGAGTPRAVAPRRPDADGPADRLEPPRHPARDHPDAARPAGR